MSPVGRGSPGRNFSGSTLGATFTQSLLDTGAADTPGDPLNLILKSFVPHITLYPSEDTDKLVADKGFQHGLWELLRPFGERVQGKVTIRDSNGASRSWEDFSVRFTRFGENLEPPEPMAGGTRSATGASGANGQTTGAKSTDKIKDVENLVGRHLTYAEESYMGLVQPSTPSKQGLDIEATSPYYALYLRRLLSGIPLSSHETFAHPVACVIAISSHTPDPIKTLRRLYDESSQGEMRLPAWVDPEYLRYYVLVHDEENSDITKSMALFDQMKRHLGLHCHLLRIRSSQSAETDDDSIPLPRSDWMTAREELDDIERHEAQEDIDLTRYIFESDATAIRTFIREMVTQSIIPTMERNVSLWNDQVASRRRGISGRFMSLSKRWGGFGGGSRTSGGGNSSSNYDPLGFYRPDTPEAIMRKLADFAFMLRDWKLAMSTYEILRSDFSNDKAWRHHAAANEMAAIALLIMPQNMSSKTRLDTINGMIEQAFYSYHTRCMTPYGSLRCLALSLELLRLRGGPAIDEAVRWGMRLMETRIIGIVGDALFKERMAIACATKQGVGSQSWGSWRRKSAMWSVLGAEAWINQSKYIQAQTCLNQARRMYSMLQSEAGIGKFLLASDHMAQLNQRLKEGLAIDATEEDEAADTEDVELLVAETTEMLSKRRSRRLSLAGPPGATGAGLETAPMRPLNSVESEDSDSGPKDGFG